MGNLRSQMLDFLGHAIRNGATEEEQLTLVKAIGLIEKYLLFNTSNKIES